MQYDNIDTLNCEEEVNKMNYNEQRQMISPSGMGGFPTTQVGYPHGGYPYGYHHVGYHPHYPYHHVGYYPHYPYHHHGYQHVIYHPHHHGYHHGHPSVTPYQGM